MAQAQIQQLQSNGKYLWQEQPNGVDEECKLYADTKYPHRDSLDHPIKHSGAMCATFVPLTMVCPPLVCGLYYSCTFLKRRINHLRKYHFYSNFSAFYHKFGLIILVCLISHVILSLFENFRYNICLDI